MDAADDVDAIARGPGSCAGTSGYNIMFIRFKRGAECVCEHGDAICAADVYGARDIPISGICKHWSRDRLRRRQHLAWYGYRRNMIALFNFTCDMDSVCRASRRPLRGHCYWEIDVQTQSVHDFIVGLWTLKARAGDASARAASRVVSMLSSSGELRHDGRTSNVTSPFSQRFRVGVHVDGGARTVEFFKDSVRVCEVSVRGDTFQPVIGTVARKCFVQISRVAIVEGMSLQYLCCRAIRKASGAALYAGLPIPDVIKSVLSAKYPWLLYASRDRPTRTKECKM